MRLAQGESGMVGGGEDGGGGNRELTLLIHLLVAFPVYILPTWLGYDGL